MEFSIKMNYTVALKYNKINDVQNVSTLYMYSKYMYGSASFCL